MAQGLHILRLAQVRAAVSSGEARRLREEAQLSIGEVARACGVDQSTVWRWERGTRQPRGRPALALADLLEDLRKTTHNAYKNSDGVEESCQAASTPPIESPLTSAN
jgi:DNA-binding transcriptional regulator YiaG